MKCCVKSGDNLTVKDPFKIETVDENYTDLDFIPYGDDIEEPQMIFLWETTYFTGKSSLDHFTDQPVNLEVLLPQGEDLVVRKIINTCVDKDGKSYRF